MQRTTTLLLAAAASAATLKLLSKIHAQGTTVVDASANMAHQDLVALQAHVRATGIDVSNSPLFSMVQGAYPDDYSGLMPA